MTGSEEHDALLRKTLLYAAGLCARSEQCESDIRVKLRRRLPTNEDVERVMTYLKRHRYLDNSRYAAAFVRTRSRLGGWGPWKIRQALAAKGIERDVIAEAMLQTDREVYLESAMRAASVKARNLDLALCADRQKLFRHLMSKGFDSDTVTAVMRRLAEDYADDDFSDNVWEE